MLDILMLAAGDGHAPFYLDPHTWGLVVWTGLTFGIVLVILYKVAWGPLLDKLEEREAGIAGEVENATRIRREADEVKARYEAQLEDIRKEAQSIIDEAESDKKGIIKEAHSKAAQDAKEIRARAERDVHLAKEKALAEVRLTAVGLAMDIAGKVITAEVDGARHQAIVDGVLANYAGSN
jgi:F-type H+-transporting ATPase subunit b